MSPKFLVPRTFLQCEKKNVEAETEKVGAEAEKVEAEAENVEAKMEERGAGEASASRNNVGLPQCCTVRLCLGGTKEIGAEGNSAALYNQRV